MQEITLFFLFLAVVATASFWAGLCWSDRAWADMQDEIELQKTLNDAMSKGIELRDAQINQLKRLNHLN